MNREQASREVGRPFEQPDDQRVGWVLPCELLEVDGMPHGEVVPHVRFIQEWREDICLEEHFEQSYPATEDFQPRWWPLQPFDGC